MSQKSPLVFLPFLSLILLSLSSLSVFAQSTSEKKAEQAKKAAIVGKYASLPWTNAIAFKSKSYDVKTNTDQKTAEYIGALMDFAQKKFRMTFSYEGEIPVLPIYAYQTYEEYLQIGRAPAGSAGFFRYLGADTEIHVAYVDTFGKTAPTSTLLHEGTHQFVHLALSMPIPAAYQSSFPKEVNTLQAIPVWLNEGFATYMEKSYFNGKFLVVGEINKDRLKHLQSMIKKQENGPLQDLFQIENSANFQLPHYAIAWGVAYWFLHDRDKTKANAKKAILKQYVDAIKLGFMTNPETEMKSRFFDHPDYKSKGFWPLWNEHIQKESYDTFVRLTVKEEKDFSKWQTLWEKWILNLNTSDPYGGLQK